MTQSEAQAAATRMQAEHADRTTHRFFAQRSADGSWAVSKLRLPGRAPTAAQTTAEHPPHHPFADDTRSGHETRIPGLPGGLG